MDTVTGNYEFEIVDNQNKGEIISVRSNEGMLNFDVADGEYTIRLNKNSEYKMEDAKLEVFDSNNGESQAKWYVNDMESPLLNLVKITSEEEHSEEEGIGVSEVKAKVLFDNQPMDKFDLALYKVERIRNSEFGHIVQHSKTDSTGECTFDYFEPNLKYEIRLRSTDKTMTFETEVFELKTNEKGLVISINGKSLKTQEYAKVVFKGTNKDSETLKRFPVSFYVYSEDGKPVKDVEFAINRLSPRLSAYRKVKSDEKGKITVELEGEAKREGSDGRLYNITVAKMEMFKHNSTPVAIDFNVDEKGNVKVIKIEKEENKIENVNSELNETNSKFTIKKVNKEYILDDFKAMYEKAVNYLKNTKFMKNEQSDKFLKDFERAIDAAKLELEETIPEYASMKIKQLQEAMENLKPFEVKEKEIENPEIPIYVEKNNSESNTKTETTKPSWEKLNGTWYYKDEAKKDVYKDTWGKIDNVWYRFDNEGKMLSNTWFKDTNGRWYWLESSGAMSENEWIYVDGSWFWAYGNGIIAENELIYVDGNWYYAKSGGYIAQNESVEVDGIIYNFDSNGA